MRLESQSEAQEVGTLIKAIGTRGLYYLPAATQTHSTSIVIFIDTGWPITLSVRMSVSLYQ